MAFDAHQNSVICKSPKLFLMLMVVLCCHLQRDVCSSKTEYDIIIDHSVHKVCETFIAYYTEVILQKCELLI